MRHPVEDRPTHGNRPQLGEERSDQRNDEDVASRSTVGGPFEDEHDGAVALRLHRS
jgi:hypothetical protein